MWYKRPKKRKKIVEMKKKKTYLDQRKCSQNIENRK